MSSPSTLAWRRWEIAALTVITAVGAWLRVPHLQRGITGDEHGLLQFRGLEWVPRDLLSALHPPLFRTSFRLFLEPSAAVQAGRSWSFICGLATIVVVAALTRRVSRSRVAGLLAAALCAGLAAAILWSTFHRPYATWLLLVAAHVWAVISWAECEDTPALRHNLPVIFTALLLPQIHYISVPWLCLFGAGVVLALRLPWRRLWVYLPAAVAFVPLVWFLLGPSPRGPGSNQIDLWLAWERLFGMGMHSVRYSPPSFAPISIASLVTIAVMWRRLGVPARVCLVGAVAIIASVTAGAFQHAMTSSTVLLGLPVFIPLVVSLPFLFYAWFPRWVVPIVVGSGLALSFSTTLGMERYEKDLKVEKPRDRLTHFLDHWQRWVPEGHEVGFAFSTDVQIARLVLTDTLMGNTAVPGCGDDRRCFVHGGHRWVAADLDSLASAQPMTVVWSRGKAPDPLPAHCSLAAEGPQGLHIAQCRVAE